MPGDSGSVRPSSRRVVLAGATGLVGSFLLRELLDDASVAVVHALGRRKPDLAHPKLVAHAVDFAALRPLPAVDEAYLALGTTIRQAGSRAAFRAIDFDANLAVARVARDAGARRLGVVSAMGADARSPIFYSRVKGELEEALAGLGFDGLVIARPSLLQGDRAALGQPPRAGERVAAVAGRVLRTLVPANHRPIAAADVAHALLARVPGASGREVLPSGAMRGG